MTAPVQLSGVGKRYTKYSDAPMLASAAMRFRARTRRTALWALRDVDLEVGSGECVGVIGRNGSGKSTMLQMLAGVTSPTEGVVRVRGRIAPLISVGVGFHPELTGRENVFVNGMILGLSRRQIAQRLESIAEFAELPDFLDTPVKFYSSGMFVRLGFSVAIHAEPEVLLIDEVLAVGDLAFQLKCFERMMEIRQSGTTVLVVSHNLNAVRKLCDRTTVLHNGQQRFEGATADAISVYHDLIDEQREIDDELDQDEGTPARRGVVGITDAGLIGPDGARTAHVRARSLVALEVQAEFAADVTDPILGLSIVNDRNVNVYSSSSMLQPLGSFRAGDRARIQVALELPLVTGSYTANLAFRDSADVRVQLARARPINFYVSGSDLTTGVVDLGGEFVVRRLPDDGGAGDGSGESPEVEVGPDQQPEPGQVGA